MDSLAVPVQLTKVSEAGHEHFRPSVRLFVPLLFESASGALAA